MDLLGTRSTQDAVNQITEAIYQRFGKSSSGFSKMFQQLLSSLGAEISFDQVSGMQVFNIGFSRSHPAERSLHTLGEFLANRKKPIIIALDEFQQINHYEDSGKAVFRSWIQRFPQLRFIFSGSHRHLMLSMFAEKNRPFYRSCQLMQLSPIPEGKYTTFIKTHFTKAKKPSPIKPSTTYTHGAEVRLTAYNLSVTSYMANTNASLPTICKTPATRYWIRKARSSPIIRTCLPTNSGGFYPQ